MNIMNNLKEFASCVREGAKGVKEMTQVAIQVAKPEAKKVKKAAKEAASNGVRILKGGFEGALKAAKSK